MREQYLIDKATALRVNCSAGPRRVKGCLSVLAAATEFQAREDPELAPKQINRAERVSVASAT